MRQGEIMLLLPRKLYTAVGLGTPHLEKALQEGFLKEDKGVFAIDPGFFPQKGLVMKELRQLREIQTKRAIVDGLVLGLIFAAVMMFFAIPNK